MVQPNTLCVHGLKQRGPNLSTFNLTLYRLLRPFRNDLPYFGINLRGNVTLYRVMDAQFPIVVFKVNVLSIIRVSYVSFQRLLTFKGTGLFLLHFLYRIPFGVKDKMNRRIFKRLVNSRQIILSFLHYPMINTTTPTLRLFRVPIFCGRTIVNPRNILRNTSP